MERLRKEEKQGKPVYDYFGHEHPLELDFANESSQIVVCSICSLNILPGGKGSYTCKICPFALHALCFKFPRKIHHPAEPNHELILGPMPSFQCKACGNQGSGFSYTCRICTNNYHCLCTRRPLSISYKFHDHPLKLEYSPPYEGCGGFRCDICGKAGGDHWVCHCSMGDCEYDAHLECANSGENPILAPSATRSSVTFQVPNTVSVSGSPSPSSQPASPSISERSISSIRSRPDSFGVPVTNQPVPVRQNSATIQAPSGSTTNLTGSTAGVSQGSNLPNGLQPNVENFSPTVAYVPNNQACIIQPNVVPAPVTILTGNQAYSHGNLVTYASNQGGMASLVLGSCVSGVAQAVGQELLYNLMSPNNEGSDSLHIGVDCSETLTSWVGGSDV